MYAQGLSTRDIEDALYEATGDEVLSKSSVSRVAEALWADFEEFQGRDLSSYELEHLFVDAIYENIRKSYGIKEAILVAWGIQRDGSKVLVSLRLRCWFHRMQNFAAKVPPAVWPELKAEIMQVRDASSYTMGKKAAASFIQRYTREYPSLISSFSEDLEAILGHLRLPVRHRKSIRTTTLIERSFVEERRRTKVIPGFFTERSALKLIFSSLLNASKRWHRISMTDMDLKRIDALRKELKVDDEQTKTAKLAKKRIASA